MYSTITPSEINTIISKDIHNRPLTYNEQLIIDDLYDDSKLEEESCVQRLPRVGEKYQVSIPQSGLKYNKLRIK